MHEKLEITSSMLNPKRPTAHKTHYSQRLLAQQLVYYVKSVFLLSFAVLCLI